MYRETLEKMQMLAAQPEAMQATQDYLAQQLLPYLKKGERVLLCLQSYEKGTLGWLMEQALLQNGAVPVRWGPDRRWKTLLQQAFVSRASTIIGPPLIVLGLTKLKKNNGTPLYIRNVVTVGYPCLDWMIDGIMQGLDCGSAGSFGVGETGIVAGFSCDQSGGIHIREDIFNVEIVDEDNQPLPCGSLGQIVLISKSDPTLRYPMGEQARLDKDPCPCGCTAPRLVDFYPGSHVDVDLIDLGQQLQSWTSVLDCRMKKGDYGLELELVVFPGEKLPKLPTAPKLIVRPWNPGHDEPFIYQPSEKNMEFFRENH